MSSWAPGEWKNNTRFAGSVGDLDGPSPGEASEQHLEVSQHSLKSVSFQGGTQWGGVGGGANAALTLAEVLTCSEHAERVPGL